MLYTVYCLKSFFLQICFTPSAYISEYIYYRLTKHYSVHIDLTTNFQSVTRQCVYNSLTSTTVHKFDCNQKSIILFILWTTLTERLTPIFFFFFFFFFFCFSLSLFYSLDTLFLSLIILCINVDILQFSHWLTMSCMISKTWAQRFYWPSNL